MTSSFDRVVGGARNGIKVPEPPNPQVSWHDPVHSENYTSAKEVWYHYAAMSRMYHDMGVPIPEKMKQWVAKQLDHSDSLFYLAPDEYRKIPLLKLICIYGVHFGVHGHLEQYYLCGEHNVTHDNIYSIAKRMAVVLSMKEYVNRFWYHMIEEGVTQASPRMERGNYNVRCSFSSLSSWVDNPSTQTYQIKAGISSNDGSKFSFRDTHPFSFEVDIQESSSSNSSASYGV